MYRIGELAKLADVTPDTIRFYEKQQMMDHEVRTEGGFRLYSENDYPSTPSERYRYGQYLVANLFWNITPDLQVGAEYLRGWRTDFNDQTRHANRLNLAVQYSF